MKRLFVSILLALTMVLALAPTAFSEQGVLNGDEYTFTDRAGNTVTVPVNSFAAYVVDFQHGDPWTSGDANTDPQIAVGLPDYVSDYEDNADLCLGRNGVLILGFDTAIYDGQGDDVYIFEVGGYVEETKVEISDDLVTWYEIGVAEGSTAGLDIAGKVPEGSGFRYVRLTDTGANPNGSWPGADIDAVCGLNVRALPVEPPADPTTGSSASDGIITANAGGVLPVNVRDFNADSLLFEGPLSSGKDMVAIVLGSDDKPVYNLETWKALYGDGVSEQALYALFNDVPGTNLSTMKLLTMTPTQDGMWELDSSTDIKGTPRDGFFPIDDKLFGNEGRDHNYHFSAEIHTKFRYKEGATFYFEGDDDVWVFLNGKLVIDLGGVHSRQSAQVAIDDIASDLGIAPGDLVDFDMFYMERHTTASNLYILTNFDFLDIAELVETGELDARDLIDAGIEVEGVTDAFVETGGATTVVSDARTFDDRFDLVGTWQGFYLGMSDDVGIVRHIQVGITDCSDGTFSGSLFFETPTDPEETGEYRIEGTVDASGNVHFQGTDWIIFYEDFNLPPFDGVLCECGDTVNGIVNNDVNRAFFIERVERDDIELTVDEGIQPWDESGEGPGEPMPPDVTPNELGDDGIAGTIDDYPVVWSNYNVGQVSNGTEYAPTITVDETVRILFINTYHWNGGRGVLPGELTLVDYTDKENPVVVGQWGAIPRDGYMGAPNVYWDVSCDVVLEPGRTYVVYDSDWQTWSCNDESDGEGFVEMRGYPTAARK